ncbi:hypothetical protein P153DRAFT_337488 [Dothidotthia symphoricarpi CBS 119687]|uniref:Large ribosomal subunit protein eL14 domain-containing protein n=1 Tax=Dothidotthia symphoricarpi CBS 119687 TaxID=1392245 RepID=A0A6A6AIV9_9PLEO|nr:uncharacterized protein P153DRAFT_337488 [Dothidotthia symphoricarpi CBS 119687]KAF2131163.1 hypothetical protein P153DRAFT_337488 [Dothidotthia symphoricarpi CBS 119687]
MRMDLTPIRIRGKRKPPTAPPTAKHQLFPTPPATTQPPSKRQKTKKKNVPKPAMPTLQGLPQELLEIIFLYSMNISLPRCCPSLGRKLSSRAITLEYTMRLFFHTINQKRFHLKRKTSSIAALQSPLLSCRFFTWDFFLAYVAKAQDARIDMRGKFWYDVTLPVPGIECFDGLVPTKFGLVNYLGFAERFFVPDKLLCGPWTDGKVALLYVLVSWHGQIDWEGSLAGEVAKRGIRGAFKEGNQRAVAALAVLLGVAKAIDTNMLTSAAIDSRCNINIFRHLLFNAQINRQISSATLDFLDPALWAVADANGARGQMVKNMLRKADAFELEFDFDEAAGSPEVVPFPYKRGSFDTLTGFNDTVREKLETLYRNYGLAHTDEMGDADITTSNWRLVEVGRVVLFNEGQYEGRLATVVEIIDHKRVLVDGPSEKAPVPRQEVALAKLSLTPIVIPKLPRATGVGFVAKQWKEHKVQEKFDESAWAKKRAALHKRRALNDFERFKVMKMRKQARFEVQKTFAKIRASAKA